LAITDDEESSVPLEVGSGSWGASIVCDVEGRESRSPESSGGWAAVASVGAASARSHEDERTNELNHRETRQLFHWRTRSGNQHGHGSGMPHSLTRSASYGDLHNDVEYVAIRTLERLDQVPEHRRRGVYRIDNQGPARVVYRRGQGSPVDYQYFDEDDFETASEVMSDRESSFNSSTAGHHRVNSFRFREEVSASPVSAVEESAQDSRVASFRGYERLYDISSQIEAAMNEIERISLQQVWSQTDANQPPATPLTHRSCFQLTDEEDEEEDIEWSGRIRDAVFIFDDLESESESDEESIPPTPLHHDDRQSHHQWLSPVEY